MAARTLARWLLAQGVPVADLSMIKPPRAPERIQPRLRHEEFLSLEQTVLRRLLDGYHFSVRSVIARDLALLNLLADTGLRCGEVCSMRTQDVDFDRGTISVWRGKGHKQRVLSIVDAYDPHGGRTLHLLAQWLEARETMRHTEEHDMLWVSLRGTPLTRTLLRSVLSELCKAAWLPSNRPPHAFRRANFTESYRDDPRAIKLLAARMGWSEKSTHMIATYTRGAELELAATEALPSLASRWHETPSLGMPTRRYPPILQRDVGPTIGTERRRPATPVKGNRNGAAGRPAKGRIQ